MKVVRYLRMTVTPNSTPGDLFHKFDIVCDEARRALLIERRDPFRDPYRLEVVFISAGRYQTFENAARRATRRGRFRPLSIRELMNLNLIDVTIRSRFPIFAGDFVLEYEICDREEGNVVVANRKWALKPSGFHRGCVLDRDSVFAMAFRTDVDKGRLLFDHTWSNTDHADEILRKAGLLEQTLRLTA